MGAMTEKIALLGVGMMGEALLAGLLAGERPASAVVVSNRREARAAELHGRFGVANAAPAEAVKDATAVIVAVKPADVPAMLETISPSLAPGVVVVSVAAGVTTSTMEAHLPAGTAVVRAMPNTPSTVGEGMTGLSAGANCPPEQLAAAEVLLASVGRTIVVKEEQQDALTAISGSGPAYVFYIADALAEAGVLLGLPRAVAAELVAQTLFGSAKLLRDGDRTAVQLREAVTSPGGTTVAGLRTLDERGVRAGLIATAEAARDRSRAMTTGG
jgi:pyrroline-5-carboxylate reductase